MIRLIGLALFTSILVGCAGTSQKAPVIDRMPAGKPATKAAEKDWRPDTYTVKKGDTLYSIGLEHGYDYKEIALTNNIRPPYTIYVGQQIKLKPSSSAVAAVAASVAAENPPASADVVITPLDLGGGPVVISTQDSTTQSSSATPIADPASVAQSSAPAIISGPIAMREPYSDAALNTPVIEARAATVVPAPAPPPASAPVPTPTTTPVASPAATPEPSKTAMAAPSVTATNAGIIWSWPTSGKVLAGFNQGGNAKGIDIGGTSGQPIVAAAQGKVIYSGSDLRGYGKLVIVKHNADYLSVYAHNSKILVKEGENVARGQKIAEMGNTDTDRTKLHFEIRHQGKSVDPAGFLPANPG